MSSVPGAGVRFPNGFEYTSTKRSIYGVKVSYPSEQVVWVKTGLEWQSQILNDGTYSTYDINDAYRLAQFMGASYTVEER